jgi:hypothetical protein
LKLFEIEFPRDVVDATNEQHKVGKEGLSLGAKVGVPVPLHHDWEMERDPER